MPPASPPVHTSDAARTDIACVSIGRHRIGPGEPTFIIAEAGVNHDGDLDKALRLVDAAAEAGADAVKFQMFSAAELVTADAATADYQRKASGEISQQAMLRRLELPIEAFETIKAHCAARSILFLATPFGLAEVLQLVTLGAEALKIASTDLTNSPLLTAAADTNLPIILSTGASTADEIRAAVAHLDNCRARSRLILLHCVSCYPTPVESLNLRRVRTLQETFRVPAGLSDHSTATHTGAWAVAAGACVLEKHLTLDRGAAGPDHAMSLDPAQLAEYIGSASAAERACGNSALGFDDCESPVRTVAARSVVAAVDILAGTRLTDAMLTLKRPGTGIPAVALPDLRGHTAGTDIPRDTILSWEMIR